MKPNNEKKLDWPIWETPSEQTQLELANSLMPYVKILDPPIVEMIVKENNSLLERWTDTFIKLNIKPEIYLWKNSPVTFPGIRRHVGNEEITNRKKNTNDAKGEDALLLDDNSFPKELWSYALRGRKANKQGPINYSLAHIIDHKDYKSRHVHEIKDYVKPSEKYTYAGLHTSCANTIWVPTNLLNPTDHNGKIRQLLLQLVNKYYSPYCQLLPKNQKLNVNNRDSKWNVDNFPEPKKVGEINQVKNFIIYRNTLIDELIDKKLKLKLE